MTKRRFPILDAILLATLLPLWLAATAIHIRQIASGNLAHVGVYVSARPGGYPVVSGFFSDGAAINPDLKPGDALIRIDGVDLTSVGPYRFFALALEHRERRGQVNLEFLRDGSPRETTLPFVKPRYPWRLLPLAAGLVITGALVLVRRPGAAVARAFFLSTVAFGVHWTWFFGGNQLITQLWIVIYLAVSSAMFPLILITASLLPERQSAARRRIPRWPWVFLVNGPIALTGSIGAPLHPDLGLRGIALMNVIFIAALLALLTRNYIASDTLGRRQLKWAVLGHYVGLVPIVAADVITVTQPDWWWLHELAAVAELAIPICMFIAIVRFNMYDVDRLITATVASSVLLTALLWGVLVIVPRVSQAAAAIFGVDPDLGARTLSGLIAVGLVSLYRYLNPIIEYLLFRDRRQIQEKVNHLLSTVRKLDSSSIMLRQIGEVTVEIFGLANCAVHRWDGESYVASFATGSIGEAGGMYSDPRLEHVLGLRHTPLEIEQWQRQADVPSTLGGFVSVVPGGSRDRAQVLITVGAKRSGEDYSSSDLALLTTIADTAANELERIENFKRMAASAILLPAKYEVLGEIGHGGMGIVYKVRHTELQSILAVKILPETLGRDPQFVARFEREARVMAQLHHPHIVRVHDIGHDDGLHYLVMDYVAGQSLSQVLATRTRLEPKEALRIAWEVASALSYAHASTLRVVHRDIKPANILIEERSQRAVVTDFGIAKATDTQLTFRAATRGMGTIGYCAPEQLRGDMDVDRRADIYSLGIVLFEMLEGRPFFDDLDAERVLAHVLDGTSAYEIRFRRRLSAQLRSTIEAATQKDRRLRQPDAEAFLRELESAAAELSQAPGGTAAVLSSEPESVESDAETWTPAKTR